MPHALDITDGTTTRSLTTSGVMLIHYVPQEAKPKPGLRYEYEDVAEPIEVMLYGASTTTVQGILGDIRDLLVAAQMRADGDRNGPRVFIQYKPINDPYTWRAELRGGTADLDASAMTVYGQAKIKVNLVITRAGVWERADKVALAISSVTTSSPGTSGATIQNHAASGAGNWVQAAANVVLGTIPAPAEIEIQNTRGTEIVYRNIYIGNEVLATGATPAADLVQGEDRQLTSGGTVLTDQEDESNEGVVKLELEDSESLPRWIFSANKVRSASGRTFRVFARISWYTIVGGNTIYIKPVLTETVNTYDLNTFQQWRALDDGVVQTELNDVGTISFDDYPTASPLSIGLLVRSEAAVTVEIDFVQLFPADNFRHLVYIGTGVPNNERIVDDGIEGRAYQLNASSQQIPRSVSARGKPIMLYPGKVNRLYFLHDEGTQAPIDNESVIKIYYRPRRLTIES